jgi:hypothetical protein
VNLSDTLSPEHLADDAISSNAFKIEARIPRSQRCTETSSDPISVAVHQSKDEMISHLGRLDGFWIAIIS